jgi:type I restriction enzyme S subunit
MKDSGVEWLGEFPEHWEVQKLRTVLRNVADRNRPDLPLLSVVREKGVIVRDVSNQDENHNFIPDDLTNYKVVRDGQFAMNKMKAWQGSFGVSSYDGIVSPAYFVFDIDGVNGDFFNSAIRSKAYVPFFTQASDGVRIGQWDLSQARMREISFSAPPLSEQTAIVRYLDHVDRRVRRLVRAKRKLVALLTEQKQAIIHRAVTRGLDPDVPLKDSGVEWLGEVPEHWEIWRIGHFAKVGNGSTPSRGNPAYWNNGLYPWLNSASINESVIVKAGQFVSDSALKECHLPLVNPGSILVAITGEGKTRGKASVLEIEATINQHMAYISPRSGHVASDYLQMYLTAAYTELRAISEASGSTRAALTCEDIKHFKVAVPPGDEQQRIVSFIGLEIAKADAALLRANRDIELLNEYRTRLIADVVTGKLDVREAAAALPEVDPLAADDEPDDALETDIDGDLDELDAITEEAEA